MKRTATRTAAAMALAALAAGCATLPPTTQQQLAGREVAYVCADGKQFTAQFSPDAGYVRLVFPNRQVLLPMRGSTDALLRYGDGQTGFGTDGARAVLTDQVFVAEGDCIARQSGLRPSVAPVAAAHVLARPGRTQASA